MDKVVYAIRESEIAQYRNDIYERRRIAIDHLSQFQSKKDPEEWVTVYSVLCELVGILWHFENILEEVSLRGEWDEKNKYWVVQDTLASRLLVYIQSVRICKDELLSHGISFSLH